MDGGEALFAPVVTRRLVAAFTHMAHAAAAEPGPPPALSALTGREVEVLRLVARGLTNGAAADRPFISEAAVKTHLNRAMAELGPVSRARAGVLAYETGLVTPGDGDGGGAGAGGGG